MEEITEFEMEVSDVSRQIGLTKKEVLQKVAERKKKTHGLLSDYGALYAFAKEKGVDLNERTIVGRLRKLHLLIKKLECTCADLQDRITKLEGRIGDD